MALEEHARDEPRLQEQRLYTVRIYENEEERVKEIEILQKK